jgi:hypothetical protein
MANKYKTTIKSPPILTPNNRVASSIEAPRIEAAAAVGGKTVKIAEEAVVGTILSLLNSFKKSYKG